MFIFTERQFVRAIEKALGGSDKVIGLKDQVQKLKDELADLQTTKKQEIRDIEHLIKIKEEKLNIEHQKSELALKGQFKDKEMKLQSDYFDKNLKQLDEHSKKMQSIYEQILARLPNINTQLEIKRR